MGDTMRIAILSLTGLFIATASAQARPAHKLVFGEYFGQYLPRKLNDCPTCHLPDPPGAKQDPDADKPHNAFGARLKAVKEELRKAGKRTGIEARLDAILNEDSDGDGVSNLIEILTGHFPGDKDDRPSPAKLADSAKLVTAFLKAKNGYPWRPFEVVKRPAIPKLKNAQWVRNPVDAFIAREHEELDLKPRPEAPKAVLLRRVHLDLIGLPPTPGQLYAFLDDN